MSCAGRLERVEARLEGDDTTLDQIRERLLHRLHAAAGVGLHDRVDLLDLALADQVADGVVRQQDLEAGRGPVPSAVGISAWVTTPCSELAI